MKKLAFFIWVLMLSITNNAQNLILNPGFEQGSIPTQNSTPMNDQVALATNWSRGCGDFWSFGGINPGTPDLFDRRTTECTISIPHNKWGNRDTRLPNIPSAPSNRYVGFTGGDIMGDGNVHYCETILGTISQPLIANCPYSVSFWASEIDGECMYCSQFMGQPCTPSAIGPNNKNFIQVLLRVAGNCTLSKLVYTTPTPVTSHTWTQYTGNFTLSPADVANGYNRIEFRFSVPGNNLGIRTIYFDDVDLHLVNVVPDATFHINNHYCYCSKINLAGALNIYPVSHIWEIFQSDINGNPLGLTTTISNNQNFIFNTCNLVAGLYYTIRHCVTSTYLCGKTICYSQTFFLAPNPNAIAGPDKYICFGGSPSQAQIGTTNPVANCSYNWSGPNIISGASSSAAIVNPTTTSNYTLTVTNNYGCTASDAVIVYVDHPITNAKITATSGVCNEPITLTAFGNYAHNYIWNTGNTSSTIHVNNPSSSTIYSVTISNSCNSVVVTYTVNHNPVITGAFPIADLIYANAFTPGIIGPNATWQVWNLGLANHYIPSYNATGYELTIFDRWGGIVYDYYINTNTGLYNGQIIWDGYANHNTNYSWWQINILGYNNSHSGTIVAEGGYSWQLRLINCNNDQVVLNGIWLLVLPMNKSLSNDNIISIFNNKSNSGVNPLIDINKDIQIYPNPFSNYVIIEKNNFELNIDKIEIINVLGKIEKEIKILPYDNKIDLANYHPGIYFIKIYTNNGNKLFKIIKI